MIGSFLLVGCTLVGLGWPSQQPAKSLPDAPHPSGENVLFAQSSPADAPQDTGSTNKADPISANAPKLTLAEAEKIAAANNPGISIAHLLQLASAQVVRETRAGE